MAQAIHCDGEGHREALADVMVSRLENGETTAWCFDHYIELCRSMVVAADAAAAELAAQAEADESAAEATRRLELVAERQAAKAGESAGSPEAAGPDGGSAGPAGDESLQGGLGGPETGDPDAAAPEPTIAAGLDPLTTAADPAEPGEGPSPG